MKNSKEIMGKVLFGNTERKFISWLEYWVYNCGRGSWVAPYLYMDQDKLDAVDIANLKTIKQTIISQQTLLKNRHSQHTPHQPMVYNRSTFL